MMFADDAPNITKQVRDDGQRQSKAPYPLMRRRCDKNLCVGRHGVLPLRCSTLFRVDALLERGPRVSLCFTRGYSRSSPPGNLSEKMSPFREISMARIRPWLFRLPDAGA